MKNILTLDQTPLLPDAMVAKEMRPSLKDQAGALARQAKYWVPDVAFGAAVILDLYAIKLSKWVPTEGAVIGPVHLLVGAAAISGIIVAGAAHEYFTPRYYRFCYKVDGIPDPTISLPYPTQNLKAREKSFRAVRLG